MPFTQERLRSRHPFELFMLAASTTYSTLGLVNPEVRPGSVQETIGPAGTVIWYIFVLVGSVTALAGIFLRDRATGLTAEQVGLLAAGGATMFYAFIGIWVVGGSASASASVLAGFASACLWRSMQLHRILTRVRTGRSGLNTEE